MKQSISVRLFNEIPVTHDDDPQLEEESNWVVSIGGDFILIENRENHCVSVMLEIERGANRPSVVIWGDKYESDEEIIEIPLTNDLKALLARWKEDK